MRGGVDGGIQALYLAHEFLAGDGIHGDLHAVTLLHAGVFAFADTHEQLHGQHLLHHEERGAHGEHVAGVEVAGAHEAADGAAQDGVLLDVFVIGLAHFVAQFGGLEVTLGHTAFLVQALEALVLDFVVLDLELQLFQLQAVHFGQDLALGHVVAHFHIDLADAAALLGHDIVYGPGLDGGGIGNLLGDIAGHGLSNLYVGNHFPGGRGCAGRLAVTAAGSCGQGQCGNHCNFRRFHISSSIFLR